MSRRGLIVLLVVGVLCAGIGVGLTDPFAPFRAASFGWTAYSPLSATAYRPIDPTWLIWAPRFGDGLLALGAGTAGACIAALVIQKRRREVPAAAD